MNESITSKWSGIQIISVIGWLWLCSSDDKAQYLILGVWKYPSSSNPGYILQK